ncbi:MAG: transketolase, partial [Ligilactobacillus agilis]|uniref:transketolase n=1 Tax=Ligilactobacillus agilis TaxID=1601 RepID=UPI002432724D
SLLHLAGYDLTISDLKKFRQWNSKTPGHPEYGQTDGVEATAGPLGQGLAMAVGMAMAEEHLAAKYNRPDFQMINHYTYTLVGDGDLSEGISHEAASLAGHLKLGKLIALYDSNDILLDGPAENSFTENIGRRFESYGWQHILVEDGNNLEAIDAAIRLAKQNLSKPTIIEVKTTIGYASPNQGTNKVHGTPLGVEGINKLRQNLGWNQEPFTVPSEVEERFEQTLRTRGREAEADWQELFTNYQHIYPDLANELLDGFNNKILINMDEVVPHYGKTEKIATRNASEKAINRLVEVMPSLWGGAADLASSNKTRMKNQGDFLPANYAGRNIWFGVREFAMAATMNGIALHGGTRIFGGTFFVFTDYLRAAIRLAALQKIPVIYVLTHDSIAVGEDGPTHQPVETLASLRCIPNVQVIRPADGNETSAAWKLALETTDKPTVLVLSRQSLSTLPISSTKVFEGVTKGGYIVSEPKDGKVTGILIATGSEVNLAVQAQKELTKKNQSVRVVSMPSFDRFESQSEEYKEVVLPSRIEKRMTIEAASTFGWDRYAGPLGIKIGVDKFGASAPGELVMDKYGFNVDNVVSKFMELG